MSMTIGQVGERSGCSAPTIRYYEEIGLLPGVDRTPNGRRAYGWPQVHRLKFIRRARDLGLSLGEVRLLLDISDGDQSSCGEARNLIQAHIEAIRRKRSELESLEAMLGQMAARCDTSCANDAAASCTVFADVMASSSG